jgi:hypothetical protein
MLRKLAITTSRNIMISSRLPVSKLAGAHGGVIHSSQVGVFFWLNM